MKVAQKVGNGFVYANPVLSGMANVIHTLVALGYQTEEADPTVPVKKMIGLYSKDMPALSTEGKAKTDGEVVLLTGSTGSLGSQLLAALLVDEKVKKVYVLNRPSAQKTLVVRHEDTFRDRLVIFILEISKIVP
jgi:FlaA1/EpsC-like NDP-sugar epimerase